MMHPTQAGEKAMQDAYERAIELIEGEHGLTRHYVAIGLFEAALDELSASEMGSIIAADTLRAALARVDGGN